jgi:hypothetical protein
MIADEVRATGGQVRALTINFTRSDGKKAFVASRDRPPEYWQTRPADLSRRTQGLWRPRPEIIGVVDGLAPGRALERRAARRSTAKASGLHAQLAEVATRAQR